MATQQQPKGFRGFTAIKKIAGQTGGGPALNTIYSFPIAATDPRNPDNFTYPPVVNAQGAPSVSVQGKKTPSVSMRGIPLKRSFFTAIFLNSMIGGSDTFLDATYFNADEYLIGINNGGSTRYYQGGLCQMVSLYGSGVGGPILMDMEWLCTAGDSENSPGSITTPAVDAGSLIDVSQYDWGSSPTIDPVYTWRLTLMRPVGLQPTADGTLYLNSSQSGMFGGTFMFTSTPLATVIPTTTATLRIKIADTPTYVTFAMQLNRDEKAESVTAALGVNSHNFTLIKATAGYPVTIT